ncbi:MAG: DUF4127 family protein [Fusobacterium sp.]|nr:DUF4127 family protein [Fusobacterium sp.]
MRIGFVPIDNRPVCYTLPALIAGIDNSLELFLPPRELLGDLKKRADVDEILAWIEGLKNIDAFVISLDTIAHGGLIPSRRSSDTFEDILERLEKLKKVLRGKKVYAFSSIMRISNNNINEEEKPYWDEWGKKIFEYSWVLHKENRMTREVPAEILTDYLATRRRNFMVNKVYLDWQQEGIFDTLIFSKDDCAKFGLNVQEAETLKSLGATVKTGADEIPLSLFARALEGEYKIKPIFLEKWQKNLISNYEDISIDECVRNQIELAGMMVSREPDVELYVNNFLQKQGEIVMNIPTEPFNGEWTKPQKPYAIADVRFANGSDNAFVKVLFEAGVENMLGYSAWNTSANSLGSLLLALKVTLNAQKNGTFNQEMFNRLMLTRFLDDWAYQANVRQIAGGELKEKMIPYEGLLREKFPCNAEISYKLPWNRSFEVEIDFN